MKRTTLLAVVASVLMAACDSTTELVNPGAPLLDKVANERFPLPPTPLPDPCSGEAVVVSGVIHGLITSDVDATGKTTFFLHVNSANFKGEGTDLLTGDPTGTRYNGRISDNTRLVLEPLEGGFVTRDETTILLIRRGSKDPAAEDDLRIRTRLFLKDGQVQFVDATVECGAFGVDT